MPQCTEFGYGPAMARKVPKELADCVVQDESGVDSRLGDQWRDRPVVLAFVRHFG
jgi:hypothetical protein